MAKQLACFSPLATMRPREQKEGQQPGEPAVWS